MRATGRRNTTQEEMQEAKNDFEILKQRTRTLRAQSARVMCKIFCDPILKNGGDVVVSARRWFLNLTGISDESTGALPSPGQ